MTNYRSLVPGGYFSSTPLDKASNPTSIRSNNPGAINGASWERTYPGYVSEVETTPGNKTTIFETPEQGVAAWWNLLRIYRTNQCTTVGEIINRYGGGQDYSAYVDMVEKWSGLPASCEIKLDDDATLLKFGKAMFKYEAGKAIPWSDEQILFGINYGQGYASGKVPIPAPSPPAPIAPSEVSTGRIAIIGAALTALGALIAIVFKRTSGMTFMERLNYVWTTTFTWVAAHPKGSIIIAIVWNVVTLILGIQLGKL